MCLLSAGSSYAHSLPDSSFMYVIAVLVMIKLYQNRHSDIIPNAHTTFMVIAVVMTVC